MSHYYDNRTSLAISLSFYIVLSCPFISEPFQRHLRRSEEEYTPAAEKRSSVSWLLAAAIRMCHEYPIACLRQRKLQEGLERKRFEMAGLDTYEKA